MNRAAMPRASRAITPTFLVSLRNEPWTFFVIQYCTVMASPLAPPAFSGKPLYYSLLFHLYRRDVRARSHKSLTFLHAVYPPRSPLRRHLRGSNREAI